MTGQNMKKAAFPLLLLVIAIILTACGAAADEAPEVTTSLASEYLSIDYADAASTRNQLAYGTLLLANTADAVTSEQATALVPLWQAVVLLSGDDTTASEELTAVQDQITETLTEVQLQAIAKMQITNAMLSEFYAEYGIVLPTPIPDVTKVPGSGNGKTEEEKAATQEAAAAAGMEPGSGSSAGQAAKTLLFDKVIEYLSSVAE
jgi:hypothetical protein